MSARRKPDMETAGIAVPAHVRAYVDALGVDLAARFFLTFGGSVVYLADRPQARSQLSTLLTMEQIRELRASVRGESWVRVPTAKPFVACHLRSQGMPVAEIARTLHVADWSVRRWTTKEKPDAKPLSALPGLFD